MYKLKKKAGSISLPNRREKFKVVSAFVVVAEENKKSTRAWVHEISKIKKRNIGRISLIRSETMSHVFQNDNKII